MGVCVAGGTGVIGRPDYLLEAARATGTRRFIAQSFTGWPKARDGGPVKTEDDPLDPAAGLSAGPGADLGAGPGTGDDDSERAAAGARPDGRA